MNKTYDTMPATAMTDLGSFEITSGHLRLSDPSYQADERYAPVVAAKHGTWKALTFLFESRGIRVIVAHHIDHSIDGGDWQPVGDVGVDVAAYGIYDNAFEDFGQGIFDRYRNERTEPLLCALLEQGVAIYNGYGDGIFDGLVIRDKGVVVAAMITTIGDECECDHECNAE